jgi:hypothetical protein
MGSALDAAKFSIQQGFTGVSDPSSTFAAIDKGIKDLTDWQTKRKEDKEKLETDTATKYREAEKQAYENLPSGKNAQAQILSGLEEYKERLYTNMKLVQRGVIGANDNLIFRENGTQSFNILSDIVKDYDKQREEYIKGAEGYIDEKTGERVEPIYGSVAAALQDMQTQIGNPDFTKLGFDSKGNGTITFYETKINEQTSTRELVLDKNGNPIPQKGLDGVNLIAYKNGRNQTALRVNLDQRTRDLVGKDSLLGKKYQTMISQGGMVGVVIDDIRGKDGKQVKSLITNAAGNLITNVAEMASVLSDNGENPSQVLNDRMWGEAKRNGADMDEKIPYDYVDLETGEIKQGMKSKYIKLKTANNNQMVPVLSEEDKLAAERIAQFSVYNSLERGISGGSQRQKPTPTSGTEKKSKSRYLLLKKGLRGDYTALQSLVDEVSQDKDSTVKGFRTDPTNNQIFIVRKDGSEGGAIDLTGSFVQLGQRIAAQLGIGGEGFASLGLSSDLQISDKVVDYDPYSITAAATPYAAIENKYSPILLKSFAEVDEGGRDFSTSQRKINAEAQISTMMRDLGVTDELVIGELIETNGVVSGGMVSIGGVEVGNLTDAKTLPGILRAITNKARRNSGSGSLDDLGEGPK